MVDWNGLFKWSMQYQDGTTESKFKKMSEEDQKWLQEALQAYTFDDVDRLKQLCELIGQTYKHSASELVDSLEEMLELVEMHPRNNLNLCLSGGMVNILKLITTHEDKVVRAIACTIFSTANQNNEEVQ